MLPDVNGIEICRRVRADKNFPILLLSLLEHLKILLQDLTQDRWLYDKTFKFGELAYKHYIEELFNNLKILKL
jgi:DNA-binding response OmpR family regulator